MQDLFRLIGSSLSSVAIALVAALECCYVSKEFPCRDICITALAQLLFENQKVFIEEDQLAAVWNLYFCLHSQSLQARFSSLRLVIVKVSSPCQGVSDMIHVCKALGLLSSLYAPLDLNLDLRVLESLLKLKDKVGEESGPLPINSSFS